MSDKLKELTQRLYRDGVEKAKVEGQSLRDQAQKDAMNIRAQAESDAQRILQEAEKRAAELQLRTQKELAMAAQQAQAMVKQNITNALCHSLLSQGIAQSLSSQELLSELILLAMKSWGDDAHHSVPDMALVLGEEHSGIFAKKLADVLKAELHTVPEIQFSPRLVAGFRIESLDGSYVLSFSDADFEEFFRSFLKGHIRHLLFEGE